MNESDIRYNFTHKELLKIYHQGYKARMCGMEWEDLKEMVNKEFKYKWEESKQ